MKIKKLHLYLADLNPRQGTEPGKIRPVVVIQTDLLNEVHPSTLICPLTTKVTKEVKILRVHIPKGETSGLDQDSDILVDQVRAIDNRRFKESLGKLSQVQAKHLLDNLAKIILE